MTNGKYYVEPQYWGHWPKTLVVHHKASGGVDETRKYAHVGSCEVTRNHPDTSCFMWQCSECGEHFSTCQQPKHCPSCGRAVSRVEER